MHSRATPLDVPIPLAMCECFGLRRTKTMTSRRRTTDMVAPKNAAAQRRACAPAPEQVLALSDANGKVWLISPDASGDPDRGDLEIVEKKGG